MKLKFSSLIHRDVAHKEKYRAGRVSVLITAIGAGAGLLSACGSTATVSTSTGLSLTKTSISEACLSLRSNSQSMPQLSVKEV